ncbi:MAG: hypothetical protein NVSMB19_22480 [Vulcanimicrobiaceae bacterium]
MLRGMLSYATEDAAYDHFVECFGDGLPLVLPTADRVAELLRAALRDPDEVVGAIFPAGTAATVRDIAVNAVMAGLPSAAFSIVLAAIEAAVDPAFNLNGIQSTTHHAAPLIVVSGPLAERAGMNAGSNALGQGNRANATIGRTLRLVMTNLGGGHPGKTDMSVQGSPAKAGFCYAERLDALPWPSLAERQTGRPGATTVTLFAAEGPHLVADHRSATADRLLLNFADTMRAPGSTNACVPGSMVVAICPQHAAILARDGFDAAAIARALFERARNPLERLQKAGEYDATRTGRFAAEYGSPDDPHTLVPVLARPESLVVTVAGGSSGGFSSVIPSWPASTPVFREVNGAT